MKTPLGKSFLASSSGKVGTTMTLSPGWGADENCESWRACMQVAHPCWQVTLLPCERSAPAPQACPLQLCLEPAVRTDWELHQEAWVMSKGRAVPSASPANGIPQPNFPTALPWEQSVTRGEFGHLYNAGGSTACSSVLIHSYCSGTSGQGTPIPLWRAKPPGKGVLPSGR